jgi:hypothetical protein
MNYLKLIVIAMVFCISTGQIQGQDRRSDFNYWSVGLNFGANLFWGDMSDDVTNPFAKYFTRNQSYATSFTLEKKFLPFLSANLRGTYGGLTGYRDTWSNGTPADLYFKTDYQDFSLNAEIDILNIFNPKPRLFNMYIKGGFGMAFYSANKMNQITDVSINTVKNNAFIIPWGWGVRFDINERFGISFENTFQHAFEDDLDAHASNFSDVNDIYSYTSLGVSYRIFAKEKQPSIDKTPIKPVDTVIAITDKSFDPLKINIDGKGKINPGESFVVNINIDKDNRTEKARLQFSIPMNFEVEEIKSDGAEFNFIDNICSFTWVEFPEKSNIELQFNLLIGENTALKVHKIPGILFYNENGEEKIKSVNLNVNVEKPAEVIAETEGEIEEVVEEDVIETEVDITESETKPTSINSDLVFRVQVRAIYGGKSTPSAVARMYDLDEVVIEDYDNGYMKYLAGEFATYEEAKAFKEKLRAGRVPGAFVVGYNKGNRISSIQQAIDMQNVSSTSESYKNNNVVETRGVIYRIQIAATNKNYTENQAAGIYGVNEKVYLIPHNGLNKYLVGQFSSYKDAESKLKEIQKVVSGAFIVKYIDGKRQ